MKRILPILLLSLFAAIGAGCTQPAPQKVIPTTNLSTKVCAIHLYSGRDDDPCWELSTSDTTKLTSLLQSASTTTWTHTPEPGLGYKGLIAFLPKDNALTGQENTQVSLFDGRISYNKDISAFTDNVAYVNEANPHLIYKLDQDRQIETWLLTLGRMRLSPDVYKSIEDGWNSNIVGTKKRTSLNGLSWKTALNEQLHFSIQYPANWTIVNNDEKGVAFSYGIPEAHESIAFNNVKYSLDGWFTSLKLNPEVILKKEQIVIAGIPTLRVDTSEMGRILIGIPVFNGVYTIETGGEMINNGMLDTLKTDISYYTEDTYNPTSTEPGVSYDATYNGRVQMEAVPEWRNVKTDHLSVDIPYSADWTIEGSNVLPFGGSNEGATYWMTFGKYISGGTYVYREYQLGLTYIKDAAPKKLAVPAKNDCPENLNEDGKSKIFPPEEITVGSVHGVSFLSGGAKGCSTVFKFNGPHYTAELRKGYPIGQSDETHRITEDMQRIIESIRINDTATYTSPNLSFTYPKSYRVIKQNDSVIVQGPNGKMILGGFKPSVGHPIADVGDMTFKKIMYSSDPKTHPEALPIALYYRDNDTVTEHELETIVQHINSNP